MQAQYGAVVLAAGGLEGISNFRLDGRQLNQETALVRAAAAGLFARGNRTVQISFTVARAFSAAAAAEVFLHDHFSTLQPQADLVFTLADASTRTFAASVLESVSPVYQGLTVITSYAFRARPL